MYLGKMWGGWGQPYTLIRENVGNRKISPQLWFSLFSSGKNEGLRRYFKILGALKYPGSNIFIMIALKLLKKEIESDE